MKAVWLAVFSLAATGVAAEDNSLMASLQKSFEMPAHRSLIGVVAESSAALSPFETDGCSGGMSWSWRVVADVFPDFSEAQGAIPPWEECCVVHDKAYHDAGGTTDAETSFMARLGADDALRQCVAAPPQSDIDAMVLRYDVSQEQVRFAYELIADSMYNAVRFGGAPCSGLPWRWGFGYPGCVPGF